MFNFPIKIRCEDCEIPFVQWAYAPRIPIAGEFLTIGGYDYTVISVKIRLLTEEEHKDATNQRVVAAVCLVRPTAEGEGF